VIHIGVDRMKDKAEKRKQIYSAAHRCFLQYGYAKTTFKDIAKTAGISRPLLYSYFSNKNELFITMTKELHDQFFAKSGEILNTSLPDKEKLSKIIDIWIIDSYRGFKSSVNENDLLDGLVSISGHSEQRFRKLFIKSIEPLVGEEIAEIIVLSIRGLMDDRPPVKTLQKRIDLLIETKA
jgi:TetR/AcrR family transcriptional regulator, transcriptional repressor of aconitase